MNSFLLRFFVFVCFGTMLFLSLFFSESVQAQGINMLERSKTSTTRKETSPPKTESEESVRLKLAMKEGFSTKSYQTGMLKNLGMLLGIATVIISSFLGWQLWQRKRMDKIMNDPMFLVYELNSAHQLSEPEKRLMKELSEKNSLPTPLKLFVEPKYLLDAWENNAFAGSQPTLQQLLSKLFDIVKTYESSPQFSNVKN